MTDAPEAPRQEREALEDDFLERLLAWLGLSDPNAVHINMLRGRIAKPSWGQIMHLYPDAAGYVTPEAHVAALREAWEAGRDAVIAEAERGAGEIELLLEPTDAQRNKQFALLQLAANATALTPPAPKGDDHD